MKPKPNRESPFSFGMRRVKSQAVGYDPTTKKIASTEGEILFQVFEQAVKDALSTRSAVRDRPRDYGMSTQEMAYAISYLCLDEIPSLSMLGIDTEWALKELRRLCILGSRPKAANTGNEEHEAIH